MSPVFDFLRIVAEAAGRKNDGFCADGVGIAFLICSFSHRRLRLPYSGLVQWQVFLAWFLRRPCRRIFEPFD